MPKSSNRGASPIIIVVLVLFLAAVGYFIAQNYIVNLKSGASSVVQFANGTLVKNTMASFAPCAAINPKATYGLLTQSPVSDEGTSNVLAVTATAVPGKTPVPGTLPPKPTASVAPRQPLCTILVIQASLAEPFVGKQVVVTGTIQNGVFYATTISSPSASGKPIPTVSPTGKPGPTKVPGQTPKPSPIRTAL